MSTHIAYRDCHCGQQLAVEIDYAITVERDRAHATIEVSGISDVQCAHAPAMLDWAETPEGAAWCAEQIDAARVEGRL